MKTGIFVFRVDSSRTIGSGHLMRCITLAKGLENHGAVCYFIARALDGNLNNLIALNGFKLIELSSDNNYTYVQSKEEPRHSYFREIDWKVDAEETLKILLRLNPDWLIVDHYGLWEDWHLAVGVSSSKIMVIDDLADRRHHCHLLVDQNLGAESLGYDNLVHSNCVTLFGPQYALLRPEFRSYRDRSIVRRMQGGFKSILVNFGGGNPSDYIGRTLDALLRANIPDTISISIIYGGMAKINMEHECLIEKIPNNVTTYEMVNNMAEILTNTDLVIGAAGSSVWERCCLGGPSIVFPVALNQSTIARNLSACGAAFTQDNQDLITGDFGELVMDILNSNKLNKMTEVASNLCDGTGMERIINELNV